MKIGIITCWSSDDNYGQQLQLFALQHFLRLHGHHPFLIRYAPQKAISSMEVLRKIIRPFLQTMKPVLPIHLKERVKCGEEYRATIERNKKANRLRCFEQFREEHIAMTSCIYKSIEELRHNPPEADVYITGSDQVWRDSLLSQNTAAYFLDFGKDETKRIAYAASIGREILPEESDKFRYLLSRFNKISVREYSAKKSCSDAGRTDAIVAVDPTCLLQRECYLQLMNETVVRYTTPYLFMYVLNVTKAEHVGWPFVESYIKERGLELRVVSSSGYEPARELIPGHDNIMATIPEWLNLIAHADAIVTTSFHGVVFSVLMHRPFVAVKLIGKYASANSRLEQFLGDLGLSDRILDDSRTFQEQMDAIIDWDDVDKRLYIVRKFANEFLNEALYSLPNKNIH